MCETALQKYSSAPLEAILFPALVHSQGFGVMLSKSVICPLACGSGKEACDNIS